MKKLLLAIIFAYCTLAIAAQEGFRVDYQGTRPTIKDFVKAYLTSILSEEVEECEAVPLNEGETLTIDMKNGFLVYEQAWDENLSRIEMCFWNESDGKHKLFADNNWYYQNGKPILGQFGGLNFLRYNNSTKRMSYIDAPGFDVEYSNKSYALPRTGKDIIVTTWHEDGKKTQKTLKWNGHGFSY